MEILVINRSFLGTAGVDDHDRLWIAGPPVLVGGGNHAVRVGTGGGLVVEPEGAAVAANGPVSAGPPGPAVVVGRVGIAVGLRCPLSLRRSSAPSGVRGVAGPRRYRRPVVMSGLAGVVRRVAPHGPVHRTRRLLGRALAPQIGLLTDEVRRLYASHALLVADVERLEHERDALRADVERLTADVADLVRARER